MNTFHKIFVLVALLGLAACNQAPVKKEVPEADRVFGFKSAIVEYQTISTVEEASDEMEETAWYEDYGLVSARLKKEYLVEEVMDSVFSKTERTSLLISDTAYSWALDPEKLTGTKISMKEMKAMGGMPGMQAPKKVQPKDYTQEYVESQGGKWLAGDTVLGKHCIVIESGKTRQWLYKGLVLKAVTTLGSGTITRLATKFDENAVIAPDKFLIPETYKVSEVTARDMMNGHGMSQKKKE
jgi:hypothetical protein